MTLRKLLLAMLMIAAPERSTLQPPIVSPTRAEMMSRTSKLPLRFEANAGQWDEGVEFVARGRDATLVITDVGMAIGLLDSKTVVTLKLVGANRSTKQGERELITKSNFFLGDDSKKWRTNVPNYGQVRAKDSVPGVELVWHDGNGGFEYDLEIAAGLDASALALEIDGADTLHVVADGSLEIATASGVLVQRPPKVVQAERELHARYVVRGANRVSFVVDDYDVSRALLIDPVLTYSSYLGGSGGESVASLAIDSSGNAYATGSTASTDFPTVSAYQGASAGAGDVFITKLNANGTALVYSTYLGGSAADSAAGIAVDASGNAYVSGWTTSTNFPTANAYQSSNGGGALPPYDVFVTKLNSTGSALTYSTYLGGSGGDYGNALAIDGSGNAYVTGYTFSPNFPTASAYRRR